MRRNNPALARAQRDYSPLPWTEYFDEAHDIKLEDSSSFRVYLRNFKPPNAPPRHINPAQRDDISHEQDLSIQQVPTLVTLHGGGYSALTWAEFTRHIEQLCKCRVLAIDMRGHGDTKTSDDSKMDINTLVNDLIAVVKHVHIHTCNFVTMPRLVLIGHSMGGAIAIKCAANYLEELPSIVGFVIIDVVEGSAKEALPLMMSVINSRPSRFSSLTNAIEWSVRSGMAKNVEAARVSMPGNLLNIEQRWLAIHDVSQTEKQTLERNKFETNLDEASEAKIAKSRPGLMPARVMALKGSAENSCFRAPKAPKYSRSTSISETCAEISVQDQQQSLTTDSDCSAAGVNDNSPGGYCWRTDLAVTEPYWAGWFEGLSSEMLSASVGGKFLLLAGLDRLDKTLTIGHMQGRFMMKVLPKCGHAVHEDLPDQVATVIGEFVIRSKFATPAE